MLSRRTSQLSAFGFSLLTHVVLLGCLATVRYATENLVPIAALETAFAEDRTQEEFERELTVATDVAENQNVIAGAPTISSVMSTGVGAPVTTRTAQIDNSQSLKNPDFAVNVGTIDVDGFPEIGQDFGGDIVGESGAPVASYGAALSQITQELLRLMRQERVLVVWLFDESNSMKDDQAEIAQQFHKVYEELGIAQQEDEKQKRGVKEVLETVITSFGAGITPITPKPTSNIPEIRAAIDKIGVDESGAENTCAAITAMLDKYGPIARKSGRKLVFVLVTDEAGDDGELVDATVEKAKKYETPVYIMGRESVFGFPFARIRWKDPKYGLDHWLEIHRGPETAFPEALQWDGLHARWDAHSSGFGPYEQVRLARETGGVFFVLPGEEENLINKDAIDRRKFQSLDMKEYVPKLESRREYERSRDGSKFRSTIWQVIVRLNPYLHPELNIRHAHYSIIRDDFAKAGKEPFERAIQAMKVLDEAIVMLDKIEPLRDKEDSRRWQANYDLIRAQCRAYRVRLFQFCLAMDQHLKNFPVPKIPQNNEWNLQYTATMLTPDAQVVKQTGINTQLLQEQEQRARELFVFVQQKHPGTPWANRATYELNYGFSFRFVDNFRDPRYQGLTGVIFPKQ